MKFKLHSKMLIIVMGFFFLSQNNVMAQKSYRLSKVTSSAGIKAGRLYVFEQDYCAMGNQVTNNYLVCLKGYSSSGIKGDDRNVWTLEKTVNVYWMKNVTNSQYLDCDNDGNLSFIPSKSKAYNWSFTIQPDGNFFIKCTNSDHYLGYNNDYPTYHRYRGYKESDYASHPHNITVYELVEYAPENLTLAAVDDKGDYSS